MQVTLFNTTRPFANKLAFYSATSKSTESPSRVSLDIELAGCGASDVLRGGFSPSSFATLFSARPWTLPRTYSLGRFTIGSSFARLAYPESINLLEAIAFDIKLHCVAVEVGNYDAVVAAVNGKEKYP